MQQYVYVKVYSLMVVNPQWTNAGESMKWTKFVMLQEYL